MEHLTYVLQFEVHVEASEAHYVSCSLILLETVHLNYMLLVFWQSW